MVEGSRTQLARPQPLRFIDLSWPTVLGRCTLNATCSTMASPDTTTGSHLPYPSTRLTTDRFERSLTFLEASVAPPARVLDLGFPNPLGEWMEAHGYDVTNTHADLDLDQDELAAADVEVVTAFEILEHLVAPFNVLRAIRAPRLVATVPLRLWFASAYRNPHDAWDRHFHEFEDWQFDWLLEKAGWRIMRREHWVPRPGGLPLGVRPILRRMTPRWYAVEAVREH